MAYFVENLNKACGQKVDIVDAYIAQKVYTNLEECIVSHSDKEYLCFILSETYQEITEIEKPFQILVSLLEDGIERPTVRQILALM